MKLDRYVTQIEAGKLIRRGDGFPLFGMVCRLELFTRSSAVFSLDTHEAGGPVKSAGFLEIHYPCSHHCIFRRKLITDSV